jgi:ABC-type amino acid transport substrate-binding protein
MLLALSLLAPSLLVAPPALAQEKLVIAIYAPNSSFDSGAARYSFTSRVAQQVGKAIGLEVEPKAYARAADFEAAVKKGQVDFAILDGVYMAQRGGNAWPVLATATSSGGDTTQRWWLLAPTPQTVLDLQGKRLAFASTGVRDASFIDNALLDGEVPKLFSARQSAPDVASAVAAVSLKKADAVFAPEASGKGLQKVFDAGRIPNPAFVVVKGSLAADLVGKVKSALLASSGSGAYAGWKAGGADPYRSLASRMSTRVRHPLMAEPPAITLDPTEALAIPSLESASADLKGQYWMPNGLP